MVLVLVLYVLKGGEKGFGFLCRLALLPEASDERTLLCNMLGTVLNVPPDHFEFGFAFTH
ncbi:hypothetical protein [Methylorubrum aminovorans]